jgi:hypothetical protein
MSPLSPKIPHSMLEKTALCKLSSKIEGLKTERYSLVWSTFSRQLLRIPIIELLIIWKQWTLLLSYRQDMGTGLNLGCSRKSRLILVINTLKPIKTTSNFPLMYWVRLICWTTNKFKMETWYSTLILMEGKSLTLFGKWCLRRHSTGERAQSTDLWPISRL